MLYMITIILSILVAINFLLLRFSCNKTTKRETLNKPFVIKKPSLPTTPQASSQLAPTGS